MVFRLRHFGVALAFVFFGGSLRAEIPSEWDQPRQEIADAWRVRKEVISVGNDPIGAKQLGQIRKLQRKYDLTALPTVSLSLLREIQQSGSVQKSELLRYAEMFAPELPAVAYFQCRVFHDVATFLHAVPFCFRGISLDLTSSDGQLRYLSNLYFTAVRTFLLVSLVFLAFFLLRSGIPISRALANTLRYIPPSGIIFLVVLMSLLAWLSVGWLGPALVLFFILWRHLRGGARFVLLVLWILALLLPWAMYLPALAIRYDRNIVSTLERPLNGMFLADQGIRLRRWIAGHPDDAEALFTLGVIEKETGRYASAKEYFQKASLLRPNWHKPVVNLATIEFIKDAPAAAIATLQKAVTLAPQSVVAHFNLGKIYLNETRLDEARSSLKRSKDIDAARFAELDRTRGASSVTDFLADESLSREEILPRVWESSPALHESRDAIFRSHFPTVSIPMYWVLLGGILVVSLLVHRRWPAGDLSEESQPAELRPRSASLDIFDPNLSRAFKREYSPLHAFWEKFQERWCTLLLPGLHNLFRERYVAALVWLFVSIGILLLVFGRDRLLPDPTLLPGLPMFPFTGVALSLFGLLYVLEAIRAIRS